MCTPGASPGDDAEQPQQAAYVTSQFAPSREGLVTAALRVDIPARAGTGPQSAPADRIRGLRAAHRGLPLDCRAHQPPRRPAPCRSSDRLWNHVKLFVSRWSREDGYESFLARGSLYARKGFHRRPVKALSDETAVRCDCRAGREEGVEAPARRSLYARAAATPILFFCPGTFSPGFFP